ncbi:DUF4241 domain-containing protein [Pseudanabaena sp. PCC 6802]|uniref:DUF4241 domain-containing protein n=1 Tax=Pseudanabaena sp. PCC 6802 TaxID=118173 RepID=UPI00034B8233|nr:DUF4241 domain-containing protein [Pseudanabaena sp. PCC 6802]
MNPITDLKSVLQESGNSFQYNISYKGMQTVRTSVHRIGELILTSGRIIACDPLMTPDSRYYFTRSIPPGRYPVFVSVADFQPFGTTRFACAMLRISEQPTEKWEIAVVNDQYPLHDEGEMYGYGVDSGTGCFMDFDAMQSLCTLAHPDPLAYAAASEISSEQAWNLTLAASERFEREFCDKAIEQMEENQFGLYSGIASWADVQVDEETSANIILFSSGWGDGGYASYWGYDASGEATCLVTDFALFESENSTED